MKLEFYNCPKPAEIYTVKLPEIPEFVKYFPDFQLMERLKNEDTQEPNIIVIGHVRRLTHVYVFFKWLNEKWIKIE